MFEDQDYRENIMALFDKGYIRISQYGGIRTVAQYMINSFEYEKEFIYSGWPLKSTQKRLLALIKRSLVYCDLSELNDYLEAKEEDAIAGLFVELEQDKTVKG